MGPYLIKLKFLFAVLIVSVVSIELSLPQFDLDLFTKQATEEISESKSAFEGGEPNANSNFSFPINVSIKLVGLDKFPPYLRWPFTTVRSMLVNLVPTGPPSTPS